MSGLSFAFTADNQNFMKALNEITSGVQSATKKIEQEGVSIEEFFNRIKNIGAISFAGFGLGEMVKKIADTRAYYQDIESSMKVFLGSAEKAADFTSKLQDYAYYNMFEFSDLANASKQLIAYGNDVNDVIPIIDKLSEVAVATSVPLEEMVGLYNKAKSTGVVGAQDIASWAAKGLILKDVMKEMGTYVEGQTVSFKQLNEVLDKVTSEGGMFHGIQEAQMENISANIGQLQDNLGLMFNEIGTYLQKPIYEVLQFGSEVIDNWKDVGYAIASLLAATGAQKGIDLLTSTIDKTAAQASYAAEKVQLEELLGKKREEAQTSLDQAVASGQLTVAKAEEIKSLREEMEAQIELLTAKKASLDEERKLAETDVEALTSWKEELDEKISKTQEWIDNAEENIDAIQQLGWEEELEASKTELATLAKERDAVANELDAASKRRDTLATESDTLATQINTLETGRATAATTKQTLATRVLTAAKTMLAKATAKLNALLAANAYAIAIAAVAALGYGIYKLATYESDEVKRAKEVSEIHSKISAEYAEETKKLDELKNKLETAQKGSKEWHEAKKSLVDQYGVYFQNLDSEIEKTGTLTSSYEALTKSIKKSIVARQLEDYEKRHNVDFTNSLNTAREQLENGYYVYNKATGKNEKKQLSGDKLNEAMDKISSAALKGDLSLIDDPEIIAALKNSHRTFYGTLESAYNDLSKDVETQKKNIKDKEEIARNYGFSLEDVTGEGVKKPYEDNRSDKEKLQQELDAKIKYYNGLKKTDKEALIVKKEIEELEKELNTYNDYKADKKKSTGPTAAQTASKITKEHQELLSLLRQQAEERLRLETEYEYQRWQNRIDLMEEGERKVLEQIRLDNTKERDALNQQMKQAINDEVSRQKALFDAREDEMAAGNKKYAKKNFDPGESDIFKVLAQLGTLNGEISRIKQQLEDPGNLDEGFMTKLQDRLSELENEEIELKLSVGDIDLSELEKISARYRNLESQLTDIQTKSEKDRLRQAKNTFNEYLKEYGNFEQKQLAVRNEYEEKIKGAVSSGERLLLKAQMENALSELDYEEMLKKGDIALAFGDISGLSKETIGRLIKEMETYRQKIVETFDPEKIQRYQEALDNLRKAEMSDVFGIFQDYVPEYFQRRLEIQKQINDQTKIGIELERQSQALSMKMKGKEGAMKIVADRSGFSISDEDFKDLSKLQEMADNINLPPALRGMIEEYMSLVAQANDLDEATNKYNNDLKLLYDRLQDLDGDEYFEGLCEIVATGARMIGDLAGKAAEMTEALGGSGEALSYFAEAMGSVSNIASGFAQGGLIGGIAAAVGEAMNWITKLAMAGDARHQENIENLQKKIDALDRSYDKLGKSISKAYSYDASKLLNQQNEMLRKQQALIQQQMAEEEAKKNSDADKIQEYREKLEDIEEAINDNKEAALDAIVGSDIKSAIESFASDYCGAWESGESRALTARDTVKKMMQDTVKAAIEAAIQGSEAMENIRQKLAEFMSDSVLSTQEQEIIYGMADRLQKELDGLMGANASILNGDSFTQTATSKGWGTMTQESADILTGRFTSLAETGLSILGTNNEMSASLRGLSSISTIGNEILNSQLIVMINQESHLENISKYTRSLSSISDRLQNIEKYVRNMQ